MQCVRERVWSGDLGIDECEKDAMAADATVVVVSADSREGDGLLEPVLVLARVSP